jgi:hypothetical protein
MTTEPKPPKLTSKLTSPTQFTEKGSLKNDTKADSACESLDARCFDDYGLHNNVLKVFE